MVYCFTLFSSLMVVIKYLYYKVNCSTDVKTDRLIIRFCLSSFHLQTPFWSLLYSSGALLPYAQLLPAILPLSLYFVSSPSWTQYPIHPKHSLAEYSILIGRWEGRGWGLLFCMSYSSGSHSLWWDLFGLRAKSKCMKYVTVWVGLL